MYFHFLSLRTSQRTIVKADSSFLFYHLTIQNLFLEVDRVLISFKLSFKVNNLRPKGVLYFRVTLFVILKIFNSIVLINFSKTSSSIHSSSLAIFRVRLVFSDSETNQLICRLNISWISSFIIFL